MNEAKIRLSPKEMELLINADVILTKNEILKKAMLLLGILQERQQEYVTNRIAELPVECSTATAKISKGENYQGLPYLILDYPRLFAKENIFAIRSMIWWGHFFSITLHLSGIYKKKFEKKIIEAWPLLSEKGFYCCNNEYAWEHHFDDDNYIPVNTLTPAEFSKVVLEWPFLKLSQKVPLQEWENADLQLFSYFKLLMEMLVD